MKCGDTWIAEAELFLRKTSDGGTMILGIVRNEVWPETIKGDEVWIATIQVMPHRRFDPEKRFGGMRADQILVSAIPIDRLKEIKSDTGGKR